MSTEWSLHLTGCSTGLGSTEELTLSTGMPLKTLEQSMTMGELATTTLLSWGGTGREEMVSVHSGKLGHGALAMTRELKSGFHSSVTGNTVSPRVVR